MQLIGFGLKEGRVRPYRPVTLIVGSRSSGKSHLIRSICGYARMVAQGVGSESSHMAVLKEGSEVHTLDDAPHVFSRWSEGVHFCTEDPYTALLNIPDRDRLRDLFLTTDSWIRSLELDASGALTVVLSSAGGSEEACPFDQLSSSTQTLVSTLLHLEAFLQSPTSTCLLIDDVCAGLGEGEQCRWVKYFRDRVMEAGKQLVLSSKSRSVLNTIPLEEWLPLPALERYELLVEDFRYTGLNNFDFFRTYLDA